MNENKNIQSKTHLFGSHAAVDHWGVKSGGWGVGSGVRVAATVHYTKQTDRVSTQHNTQPLMWREVPWKDSNQQHLILLPLKNRSLPPPLPLPTQFLRILCQKPGPSRSKAYTQSYAMVWCPLLPSPPPPPPPSKRVVMLGFLKDNTSLIFNIVLYSKF